MNSGEKLKNINDSSRFYLMQKAVEMFKQYDTNASGALDREEFTRLLFLRFVLAIYLLPKAGFELLRNINQVSHV